MNDTALSKRAYDGLKAATEIYTEKKIDDEHWQPDPAVILQFGIPRLLCLPNLGRKTIEEIEDWLAAQGLTFEDTRRQTFRQRKEAEKRRRRLAQSVLSRIEVSGPHILAKLDPEELDAKDRARRIFKIARRGEFVEARGRLRARVSVAPNG